MSDKYDVTRMTDKLGEQYKITENAFKVHASCRHTHAAMDLAIELYEKVKNNGIHSIKSIEVGAYQVALDITDAKNPQTIYAAKFSMQFCVALALLTGKGGFDAFNADSLKNPLIRSLMEKMVVSVDEDIHSQYPHEWGAKIQIHWLEGTSDVMQSQFPKGDPENPLTEQDFIEKFNSLVPLEETHKEKIINQLLHLETLQVQQIIRTIHPIKHISIV